MSELVRAIRTIAGTQLNDKLHLADAEVLSVDVDSRTAQVQLIHGDANQIITARLMSSVADGCLYIPKTEGNTVVIAYSDYVEPYIALHGDIDSIVWLGGEYEGVPIVIDPNNPNNGLLTKINNIENLLNDLISQYNKHLHVASGSNTSTPLPIYLEASTITPITAQADISHPNITH
jgi:hypothetical protein